MRKPWATARIKEGKGKASRVTRFRQKHTTRTTPSSASFPRLVADHSSLPFLTFRIQSCPWVMTESEQKSSKTSQPESQIRYKKKLGCPRGSPNHFNHPFECYPSTLMPDVIDFGASDSTCADHETHYIVTLIDLASVDDRG